MQTLEFTHSNRKPVKVGLYDNCTATARDYQAKGMRPICSFGNHERALQGAISGDAALAAQSDKYMARFEDLGLVSTGFQTADSIIGAVPNIGAYLSGSPVCMRLRTRTMKEQAPLAIIVDLTTSGGISAADMSRRGSVILAAARVLSAVRPVELWAFTGLGRGNGGAVFAGHRMDTAPMDLARAAPVFTDSLWARNILYGVCNHLGSNGSWPFNQYQSVDAKGWEQIARHALPHLGDTLAIPAMHLTDPLVSNPEKWLRDTVATYAPNGE